jgi:hypothetical protein
VRCPRELDPVMSRAGGQREPGTRIGPVIRTLLHDTDPLFRRAGLDLDGGAGGAKPGR